MWGSVSPGAGGLEATALSPAQGAHARHLPLWGVWGAPRVGLSTARVITPRPGPGAQLFVDAGIVTTPHQVSTKGPVRLLCALDLPRAERRACGFSLLGWGDSEAQRG